jgi:hypothetical protein
MMAAMARLLLPLAACLPLASGGAGSSSFVCSRPAAAAGATPPTPTLALDTGTGAYTLHLAGAGSSLPSAPYRVLHGGRWLNSTAGEGLELHSRTARSGSDQHGEWSAVDLRWHLAAAQRAGRAAAASPESVWVTTFRCYNRSGMVVFTQRFPDGLTDTAAAGERSINRPSTAFPAFGMPGTTLGMVTFQGQNAAPTTQVGTWPDASRGGYDGGPVAVFTKDLRQGIALLSPLTQFMSVLHAKLFADDALSFGIGGLLRSVPAGFSVDFVVSFSYPAAAAAEEEDRFAGLMARAWMGWGDVLLRHYNQQRTRPDASPWISQLGYSTTGVFHYNPCDCKGNANRSYCAPEDSTNPLMPGCHTYEDSLLQMHAYAKSAGIPYRWWLIDSWWHAFDDGEYFEDVPAQVGQLFPHGLAWLYKQMGEQTFGAHWSSTFSATSPYIQNFTGGGGTSLVAANSSTLAAAASPGWVPSSTANGTYVPINQAVWDHIFASDTTWGLRTIKIDHLYEAFIGHATPPYTGGHLQLLSEPYLAHEFLGAVGEAAERHGVDIMWCMSYPNVLMQSVMYPAMTHGRGSSDSHPDDQNWRGFGGESMFEWALGLWPFKDTFYTNTSAGHNLPLNGVDAGKPEHQPYTHTVVAALSGGGVTPGDVIGGTDVGLVMSTCRADGMLLKPTTPAAFIDRYWLAHASPPPPPPPPLAAVALRLQECAENGTAQLWSLDGKTGLLQSSVTKRCLNLGKCRAGGSVHLGICSISCGSPECCGGNNTKWSLAGGGSSHTSSSRPTAVLESTKQQIHSRAGPDQCLSERGAQAPPSSASQIGVAPCNASGPSLLSWQRHPASAANIQIKAANGSCLTAVLDEEEEEEEEERWTPHDLQQHTISSASNDQRGLDGSDSPDESPATTIAAIGETSSGETVLQGHVWKYVTVIPPNDAFTLLPADVGLRRGGGGNGYLVYGRHAFSDPPLVSTFSTSAPIAVSARGDMKELQLWVAAPVLENGWTLLGERDKVVPVAAQRIVSFETLQVGTGGDGDGAAVVVELMGAENESVTMDFARPGHSNTVLTATCNMGVSGRVRLTVPAGGTDARTSVGGADFSCDPA